MISNKKYNTTEKFKARVESIDRSLLKIDKLKTLQVNLGNICNLSCTHCHVQASPDGKNIMPASIMDRIVDFLKKRKGLTVDMTGGCPELNPDFRYFLEKVSPLADKLIARTNLSILTEPSAENIPLLYKKSHVIIVGSMPCYTERNVNEQRGNGVFAKNIKAIKLLNSIGYGIDENLELNLVYNPSADFLPASQE
ncbi:MAG: radical SAM protein, partial [Planctomycetes bacterium]|nr:radical SAM protein [Planctomycetota bacterium]